MGSLWLPAAAGLACSGAGNDLQAGCVALSVCLCYWGVSAPPAVAFCYRCFLPAELYGQQRSAAPALAAGIGRVPAVSGR